MKIKKLAVKGFMRFKEQQEITFPENVATLIFGENGVGKTSLLDAICVSLYGRTFRTLLDSERGFLKVEELVNHDSSEASIHFEFENHGHNYVVRREIERGKSDGELLEDGEPKAQGDAVFEYVSSKAIGLDWEGFSRSTVILQGEMSALTNVLPATRKEAFVKLFGLAKYGEYEKTVREEIEQKNLSVQKMETANEVLRNETAKIPQVESSLKRLKKTVIALEQQKASSGKKLEHIKSLTKTLEKNHRTYLALNRKIEKIATDTKNLERTLEQRKSEFEELIDLKKDFRTLERSYKEFLALSKILKKMGKKKTGYDKTAGKMTSLKGSLKEKKDKLSELVKDMGMSRKLIATFKKEVPSLKKVTSIREEMARLEHKKIELERRKFRLEALLDTANDSMNELRDEMERIKRKHTCPVCSQRIANTKGILKSYLNEINALAVGRRKKQRELGEILMQLKKVGRSLHDTGIAMSRIEGAYSKQNELLNEVKRLDALKVRSEKVRHDQQLVKRELEKYEKQLKSLGFDVKEYSAIERRISRLRQEKIAERYSGANVQVKQLPQIRKSMDKTKRSLSMLQNQRARLLARIKKFGDIERRFVAVKEELESLQNLHNQNLLAVAKEKTNYKTLAKQSTELKEREKKLQQNEDEIEELREEISSLEELMKIFANIPQSILHRLIPFIEKEGTTIINELSGGAITALNMDKDNLNIGATIGSEVRPIQYFSGGQQTRINIALRVAISRILNRFPQTKDTLATMQTLIIDEGDFGVLDEAGIRDAMTVLQNMGKEFSRIILISHLDSVKANFRGYTVEVIKTGPSQSMISTPVEEVIGVQPEPV